MPLDMQAIMQAFQMGQQARLHEMQIQEMQRKQEIESQLPQARAAYFNGNPRPLQQLDPNAFRSLELLRAQAENQTSEIGMRNAQMPGAQAKSEQEQAAAALERHTRQAVAWGNILRASGGDPQRLNTIKRGLAQNGVEEAGRIPDVSTPEEIAQLRQQNDVALAIYTQPKTTDHMIEVAGALGIPVDQTLTDSRAQPLWRKLLEKGAMTINIGDASKLTQGAMTNQQEAGLAAAGEKSAVDRVQQATEAAGGASEVQTTGHNIKEFFLRPLAAAVPGFVPQETKDDLAKEAAREQAVQALASTVVGKISKLRNMTSESAQKYIEPFIPKIGGVFPDPPDVYNSKLKGLYDMANSTEQRAWDAVSKGFQMPKANAPTSQAGQPPAPDRIRVRLPDGRVGTVPKGTQLPQGAQVMQ